MPMPAGKNFPLSPAAADLGLGDALTQQLADQEADRKKKVLLLANQKPNAEMSPAALLLFGQGGNFGG